MNTILFYVLAVVTICVIAKIFSAPMKLIIKILINALIGGLVLLVLNLVGGIFGFHIDVNWLSALITGFLGIPGVIIVLILQAII